MADPVRSDTHGVGRTDSANEDHRREGKPLGPLTAGYTRRTVTAAYCAPQLIVGWRVTACPGDAQMHDSRQTIYRPLLGQLRRALRSGLTGHVRSYRPIRFGMPRADSER